uniref:Neuropeptide F n=1 Tax=Macrostomum lignano TaxID=282301 RepID=A0A1I8GD52_9PLAT
MIESSRAILLLLWLLTVAIPQCRSAAVQSSTDPDKPLDWFRRPGLQAAVAVAAADKRQFANTEALRQELRRILYRIQHGSGDLRYG